MVTNDDEYMADIQEDCEHAKANGLNLDFDQDEYDWFLLKNPDLEQQAPEEEGTEPKQNLSAT